MKQMKLTMFCKEFGMPNSTVKELIHRKDFPAFKIGKCWYIDIDKFYKWREIEHQKSYKWA